MKKLVDRTNDNTRSKETSAGQRQGSEERDRTLFERHCYRTEAFMKYHALLLAPVFASVFAGPASAQAVIDNPGMCAQFYPDANCENYGPGNPCTGGYSSRDLPAVNAFNVVPAGHPSLKKRHVHEMTAGW